MKNAEDGQGKLRGWTERATDEDEEDGSHTEFCSVRKTDRVSFVLQQISDEMQCGLIPYLAIPQTVQHHIHPRRASPEQHRAEFPCPVP